LREPEHRSERASEERTAAPNEELPLRLHPIEFE
jgi:hypothetical protein